MAGNVNTLATLWGQQRTHVEGKWPEALVVLDLNYWADPKACEHRKRPGIRKLAEVWGWPKTTAAEFIKRWDSGQLPYGRRTVPGHSPDTRRRKKADNRDAGGHSPDSSRTPSGQSPDSPLGYTRANVSVSTSPSPIQEVWSHYRARRPTVGEKPSKDAREKFSARMREGASVSDMKLMVDYVFDSDDWWPKAQRESRRTGPGTWAKPKGWDERLASAREWHADGRGKATNGAEHAWAAALHWVKSRKWPSGYPTDRLDDALAQVGGLRAVGEANEYTITQLRRSFVEAYNGRTR